MSSKAGQFVLVFLLTVGPGSAQTGHPCYLLYSVNPGEGFNLARDVYLRAGELVRLLRESSGANWVLVLPPFTHLHWNDRQPRPWADFFDLSALQTILPVIELSEFLRLHPTVPQVDLILHLKSFFPAGGVWAPELRPAIRCDFGPYSVSQFEQNRDTGYWRGDFWGHRHAMGAATFQCFDVFGDVTVLLPTLQSAASTTIMVARFESLLHVGFGSETYWRLRWSMHFSTQLCHAAQLFWETVIVQPFLAVHLRRGDFLRVRADQIPSMSDMEAQLAAVLKNYSLGAVFIATDASSQDVPFHAWMADAPFPIFRFRPKDSSPASTTVFSEGQVAIIEQWICANAAVFVGTAESTYTFRIQEERERLGKAPETTYQNICPLTVENGVVGRHCPIGRRWPTLPP